MKDKHQVEEKLFNSTRLDKTYKHEWNSLKKKIIETHEEKVKEQTSEENKAPPKTDVVTAEENQQKYLERFGVNFDIP